MKFSEFTKKAILFIPKYLFRDPYFILLYILAYPRKIYANTALFYTEEAFLNEIEKGKSIIRIGDGEISLLHGRAIHYQKNEKALAVGLKTLIREYSASSPYIVSIPVFVNYSNAELGKTNGKLSCWLPLKVEFRRIFNKTMRYTDAHFFYYRDKMINFFKKFIENQPVIFISNQDTNEKIKAGITYPAHFIDTPSENSFSEIERICHTIDAIIENNPNTRFKLVVSTGPASKIIAYKYSLRGYQSFDIGFGLRYIYDTKDYSYLI